MFKLTPKKIIVGFMPIIMIMFISVCNLEGDSILGHPAGDTSLYPTVVAATPVNNDTNVSYNTKYITAEFSVPMDNTTLTSTSFTLLDVNSSVPITGGAVTYANRVAELTLDANLSKSTLYTATITTDAKDADGVALSSNYVWTFTTGTDPDETSSVPGTLDGVLLMQAQALFGKLPATMPGSEHDTPALIALGNKLFFEKAVSINHTQSCSSCHFIGDKGAGSDHLKTGLGALGKFGDRNDPSVLNAGFQISQFWDGRAATLEEQAKGPPLNPIEMALPDGATVAARLKAIDHYPAEFQAAFPGEKDPVTFDNFAKAVAAFERTLISRSRFDHYLDGDTQALTGKELSGMRTFITVGCVQCHSGPNLGGMSYSKTGIFHDYSNRKDLGRFKVTNLESDKYVFKVTMLRNVTLTGPYFHDGEVGTLAEAVDQMAYLQLDKKLKDDEIRNILSFLTTLADEEQTTPPLIKVAQNTTTPIVKTDSTTGSWVVPPQVQDIPQGAQGDRIRYGALLLSDTYAQLGPDVKNSKMRYTGNTLNCTSCHLDGGTKQFGLPWIGVSKAYPKYSAREGDMQTLEARINGCFERSMNGRALPVDSKEMKAIVAYMDWLSIDVPKDIFGRGTPKFEGPSRKADVKRGELVYDQFCLSCHGKNGDGYQSKSAGSAGSHVGPALWGPHSYNNGAGMNRLLTTAAFIHSNMPLGAQWNRPVMTIDDAYDVAGYLSSKPRPHMRGLAKDYPKRAEKPVDTSYPPYIDNFPQEQHQYGPFQPIKASQKQK